MTDIRDTLLDAAARLYAEGGYRGTTTRKIAQYADVNEITLFRHFGTKDELIRAALHRERLRINSAPPAADAADTFAALLEWAEAFHSRIYNHRTLVRQVLGDATEHPHLAMDPCDGADHEAVLLVDWMTTRQQRSEFARDANPGIAAHMLVNALFTDAIWRDVAPVEFVPPASIMVQGFVVFMLRGLGYTGALPALPAWPMMSHTEEAV